MENLSVIPEADKMPDFGELVYSKIGDTPFKLKLFGSRCALTRDATGWLLNFVADGYTAEPPLFFPSSNPPLATVELGEISFDAAQAVGEQLGDEGLHLWAKYHERYWSPVSEEWITPLGIVPAQ